MKTGRSCDACEGSGRLWLGYLRRQVPCPVCCGRGSIKDPAEQPRRRNRSAETQRRQKRREEDRDAVFGHYGRSCACCGTTEDLTIDHVFGGGRAHLKALGLGSGNGFYRWLISNDCPAGFQTLCGPCNGSKGEGWRCRRWHERSVTTNDRPPSRFRAG